VGIIGHHSKFPPESREEEDNRDSLVAAWRATA
jgi:hypothetical protein